MSQVGYAEAKAALFNLVLGPAAGAMMSDEQLINEAVIITAAIAQRYRLSQLPGGATGAKSVAFTLRPNGNMRVKLAPMKLPRFGGRWFWLAPWSPHSNGGKINLRLECDFAVV